MTARPPVRFEHVTKRFARGAYQDSLRDVLGRLVGRRGRSRRTWFDALGDVSFEVGRGEAVGVIGPNGSGKSTALKLITGIYVPTSGTIEVEGRIAPLIEVGAGFHPDLTGRENVYLNGAISGMSRAEVRARFDEIVEFSGLGDFLDTPVKRYSSGMYMRLGFSIAAHVPSEILVVDEVLAVGDVGFRARCIERMQSMRREGRTILFVSHSSYQVRSLCDRVIYLLEGRKVFDGDVVEGTRRYEQDVLTGRASPAAAVRRVADEAPVSLLETAVLHDAADEGVVLRPGEPLEVRVRYRVAAPPARPPVLAVGLLRGDGVMACVLNTRDASVELPSTPGDHTVVARFDELPLHPARFSVEVLLWNAEMVVVLDQQTGGGVDVRFEDRGAANRPGVFLPRGGFRLVGP